MTHYFNYRIEHLTAVTINGTLLLLFHPLLVFDTQEYYLGCHCLECTCSAFFTMGTFTTIRF